MCNIMCDPRIPTFFGLLPSAGISKGYEAACGFATLGAAMVDTEGQVSCDLRVLDELLLRSLACELCFFEGIESKPSLPDGAKASSCSLASTENLEPLFVGTPVRGVEKGGLRLHDCLDDNKEWPSFRQRSYPRTIQLDSDLVRRVCLRTAAEVVHAQLYRSAELAAPDGKAKEAESGCQTRVRQQS